MVNRNAIRGATSILVAYLLGVHVAAQRPTEISVRWKTPRADSIRAPQRVDGGPVVASSARELAALRRAYRAKVPVIVSRVRAAALELQREIAFPARGGQHNQWYQCDACQFALRTIDAKRHRCDRCDKVYSGTPYDDVVFGRVHHANMRRATNVAWAYAVTGERRFADRAAEILSGYADRYAKYPYHSASRKPNVNSGGHLFEQTLTEASTMIRSVAPAYDLVWPALSPKQRAHIEEDLLRPMASNIAKCRRGKSNWQSFHNAALFYAGALLGEAPWMRRAILDPRHGFAMQMRVSVSSDGMWYENSWGYHIYTLHALVALAEGARYCGVDLWSHPALRKMCTLPARYSMGAGGQLPRFGDDVNSRIRTAMGLLERAHAATRDPEIRNVLPHGTTFESIRFGRSIDERRVSKRRLASALFRGAGHAILRGDGPAKLSAAFTFGPFGGFHGHFDKLSFVLYGFDQELGVDPGRAKSQAYRLPIHKRWYRGTIAHNAVVVDGRAQRGTAGELLAFETGAGFAAAAARCTTAYDNVAHARCLVLTDGYLVVLDRLVCTDGQPRRFAWAYHSRGREVQCSVTEPGRPKLGLVAPPPPSEADHPHTRNYPRGSFGLVGEEFIQWQASGRTDKAIQARFLGAGAVDTDLHIAKGTDTAVAIGTGAGASVEDRVPLLIAERRGTDVTFAAVLAPGTKRHRTAVTAIRCRSANGTLTADIARGEQTDRVTWSDQAIRFTPGR